MNRIRRQFARISADTTGNFAVEFALVAPIFMLLLIALADYGMAARQRSALDAAARSGLQVLLKNPADTAAAQSMVQAIASGATAAASHSCVCTNGSTVSCTAGTCPVAATHQFVTVSETRSYAHI